MPLIYDPDLYDPQQLCLIMSELVFNECVQLCTSVLSGFITWTFYAVKSKRVFSLLVSVQHGGMGEVMW